MRIPASAFAGLLHLQVLLGFAVAVSGRFYPSLIGHIFLMLFAAVVAQVPLSVMRRRPPEARTHLPHLVSTVVALGLIWAGVAAIGRGLLGSALILTSPPPETARGLNAGPGTARRPGAGRCPADRPRCRR
jgi:hypothetical protein